MLPRVSYDVLERGEYEHGMELARQELEHDPSPAGPEWIAFALWYAFRHGRFAQALGDLAKHVQENPNDQQTEVWYARALRHDGQREEAVAQARQAVERGTSESATIDALEIVIPLLAELGYRGEALTQARENYRQLTGLAAKTQLLSELAKLYVDEEGKPTYEAFALRELAVSLSPNDTDVRFEVAYAYSDNSADKMALAHYLALLERDSKNGAAANNAGVSAGRLSLPLTSVSWQRRAEALGDQLAVANLAWGMLGAGFGGEVETLIQEARARGPVHPNLEKAAGALVSRREDEKQTLDELTAQVGKEISFRTRYARALVSVADYASLSGTYDGMPSALLLNVDKDGLAAGTFFFAPGKQARLGGKLEGLALRFSWEAVVEPAPPGEQRAVLQSFLLSSERRSGMGVLLFDTEEPTGFWTSTAFTFEPLDSTKVTEWRLRRTG